MHNIIVSQFLVFHDLNSMNYVLAYINARRHVLDIIKNVHKNIQHKCLYSFKTHAIPTRKHIFTNARIYDILVDARILVYIAYTFH